MSYQELPLIPISVVRGNSKTVSLDGISVDLVTLKWADLCPKVQFKSVVDAKRYVDFELVVGNGLSFDNDRLTLKFGRETSSLSLNKYYGDLLVKLNGNDVTIVRFELVFDGAVTTKTNNDEC